MLQEEIARLTGTLKFNVEARPLAAFEKKLTGVLGMLRELTTLANKKFTVKVALDSRSLRSQIERATRTKISLTNIDVSQEALALQGRRIQEYLNRTTIRLNNVKIDIGSLVEQKRFARTMMGQLAVKLPVTVDLTKLERELRSDLNTIGKRQKIIVEANLNTTQFIINLRRALKQAEKRIGALKLRVAEPQVRLKVDRQHLVDEIRAALASNEFRIRLNARNDDFRNNRRSSGSYANRGEMGRGLSAMGGFARGAIPGLGAAFALSSMNDINQRVVAATNSLEAVSGNQANFNSNRTYLENMTHEMGLNFRDVAPQFSSIYTAAAPSIGTGGVQDMFRGIMQYGTVHGLDKEAMKGSMVALSQMFGKDKIQSEEARQQFAERMPNGMALLARAAQNAGATKNGTVAEFSELMEKGNADPKKILPELGKLMKGLSEENNAYAKSLQTTRVAQGRMNTTFEDSVVIFARGGFDRGMASFFNAMTDGMERAKPLTEALGGAFELLVKPINALIRLVGFLGENWQMLADKLGLSKTALAALATAVAVFMLPFGGFVVALSAAVLALDDFLTWMSGGKSVFGDFLNNNENVRNSIDDIVFSIDRIKAAWDDLKNALGEENIDNPFKNWSINDALITNLDYIRSIIDGMSGLMKAVVQAKEGDYTGAAATLGGGLGGVITSNPGVQVYSGIAGFWRDQAGGAADMAQSYLTGHRNRYDKMPTESGTGTSATSIDSSINLSPGAVQLQLTIPTSSSSDPKTLARDLAPHLQEMTKAALRDALGQARAQQAERQ